MLIHKKCFKRNFYLCLSVFAFFSLKNIVHCYSYFFQFLGKVALLLVDKMKIIITKIKPDKVCMGVVSGYMLRRISYFIQIREVASDNMTDSDRVGSYVL